MGDALKPPVYPPIPWWGLPPFGMTPNPLQGGLFRCADIPPLQGGLFRCADIPPLLGEG